MPYKDPEKRRQRNRDNMRRARAERRAALAAAPAPPLATSPAPPDDPAQAFAAWSTSRLIVPPGHTARGQPLDIPPYALSFLSDALLPGVREAGLFVARKNAKTAVISALLLAHLAPDGPLRQMAWRCGCASLSKEKAVELWMQAEAIAAASGIEGVKFWRSPRAIESDYGKVDILAADSKQGHASGYDLVVCDELGLYPEQTGRGLVQGLLSSTSARDGRLLAISVIGDSPLATELIERGDDPSTVVHVHQAKPDCDLEDEAAWLAANPTLGSIKSAYYMRDMARRAAANPTEAAAFRAFDLNCPGSGGMDMIVTADRWIVCADKAQPDRSGPCFVAFDLGGSSSMTAAAVMWPLTGRLETFGAFGDTPDLLKRGEGDGVGDRYETMKQRGEIVTFPGRVTPVSQFLAWLAEQLDGETVALALADRYRQAEAQDALMHAGVAWPCEWRAQGAGKDGSADVRAFQAAVIGDRLRPGHSLLLDSAIEQSRIRYDGNGNPALDKARSRARIDCLSAAVLAVGAGTRYYLAVSGGEGGDGFGWAPFDDDDY